MKNRWVKGAHFKQSGWKHLRSNEKHMPNKKKRRKNRGNQNIFGASQPFIPRQAIHDERQQNTQKICTPFPPGVYLAAQTIKRGARRWWMTLCNHPKLTMCL